jgi:hypothetical protein
MTDEWMIRLDKIPPNATRVAVHFYDDKDFTNPVDISSIIRIEYLEHAPPPETTIKTLYDECRRVCREVHSQTDNWLVSAVQVRLLRKLYPHLLEDEKRCMR